MVYLHWNLENEQIYCSRYFTQERGLDQFHAQVSPTHLATGDVSCVVCFCISARSPWSVSHFGQLRHLQVLLHSLPCPLSSKTLPPCSSLLHLHKPLLISTLFIKPPITLLNPFNASANLDILPQACVLRLQSSRIV